MTRNGSEIIVLGGGLAGLSAAYHGGFPVYEARGRIGGIADSFNKNGFVFDAGIHVLQSKNEYFLSLLNELGVELVTHRRSGWIYSHGKYSKYPFQVNTSRLPLATRAGCVMGFIARKNHSNPSNYEEWIIQNFGKGFAKTFLIPYAEKFWRRPPSEMTYEWVGARVPTPSVLEVIKGAFRDQETKLGTHAVFQYPLERGVGFASIARAIARNVRKIHHGMRATAIDPEKKEVAFGDGGKTVSYEKLITTLPLPELVKLLPNVPSEVNEAAARLACNSIAVVSLGVGRDRITDRHWAHYPERDISFFRISFPSKFCDGLNPAGTSSVQAEVSYDSNNPPDKDALLEKVKADLVEVGVLGKKETMLAEDVLLLPYGYVIYDKHREGAVSTIYEYLRMFDIIPCGRYGEWEYLWTDQSVLSGRKAAESALATVDA